MIKLKSFILILFAVSILPLVGLAGEKHGRYGHHYDRHRSHGHHRYDRRPHYYDHHHYHGGHRAYPYSRRVAPGYNRHQHFRLGIIPPIDRDRSPYLYFGYEIEF